MALEVDAVIGPACFASALINGDRSGLTEDEERLLEAFLARWQKHTFVDCGEPFFSWSYSFHGGGYLGGDLVEYTTLIERIDDAPAD